MDLTTAMAIALAMMISVTAANTAGAERPLFRVRTTLYLCQDSPGHSGRASVCFDPQREQLKQPASDWDWCLRREVQPGGIHDRVPTALATVNIHAHALGDQQADGDGVPLTVCIEGLLRGALE